jgi:hypothetical protein
MQRIIFASITCALLACEAQAQFEAQNHIQSLRGGGRSASSRILQNPALSPYLALTDLSGNGNDVSQNYFSIVKPQLENRAAQLRQQRSINSLQRSVTAMRSAAPSSRPSVRITGHPTRFGDYGRYYPTLNRR